MYFILSLNLEESRLFLAERGMSKLSSMPIFQANLQWTGSIKLELTKSDKIHKRTIDCKSLKNKTEIFF